jgi:hypothetical protein
MDFHDTLLANGLDFVRSSLEHLTAASAASTPDNESRKRHLKYALIHLCWGQELVFKERLSHDDRQLVFQAGARGAADQAGDFKSVSFHTAEDQLEQVCGVEFTPQQKKDLQVFGNRPNTIEHFNAVETLLAMQSGIAKMVSFRVDFRSIILRPRPSKNRSKSCWVKSRRAWQMRRCSAGAASDYRTGDRETADSCSMSIVPSKGDQRRWRDREVPILTLSPGTFASC